MPTFQADVLHQFARDLLQAAGVPAQNAVLVAASLIEANLHGHDSHGVYRVIDYTAQMQRGEILPDAELQIVRETPSILVADGSLGFGQVQCRRLVDLVCDKARRTGFACGTMRRSGHIGRLGEWVEIAAQKGFAAWLSVNDNGVLRYVAPPGGLEPRISTNPFALAAPTSAEPIVLDMSTSAVARGKVRVAMLAGQQVPLGWIQDAQGNPTTDPRAITTNPPGTLLPLGGDQAFKGFGLGLLVDILTAGLAGGSTPPAEPGQLETNNVLLVVWNPELFHGTDHFIAQADKLADAVRETPCKPGVDRIRLPGDRGRETRAARLRDGISLPGDNWTGLLELARSLGITPPSPQP